MKKPINIDDVTEDNILRVTYRVDGGKRRIVNIGLSDEYNSITDDGFIFYSRFTIRDFKDAFKRNNSWTNLEIELDDEQIYEVW